MSSLVGGIVGGVVSSLVGSALAGQVTVYHSDGVVRVLIEPWEFLGISVMRLKRVDGPRPLSISGNVKSVLLRADPNNTGRIWIGDRGVQVGNGYPLDANSILAMQIRNFDEVYLLTDSDTPQVLYIVKLGEKT